MYTELNTKSRLKRFEYYHQASPSSDPLGVSLLERYSIHTYLLAFVRTAASALPRRTRT